MSKKVLCDEIRLANPTRFSLLRKKDERASGEGGTIGDSETRRRKRRKRKGPPSPTSLSPVLAQPPTSPFSLSPSTRAPASPTHPPTHIPTHAEEEGGRGEWGGIHSRRGKKNREREERGGGGLSFPDTARSVGRPLISVGFHTDAFEKRNGGGVGETRRAKKVPHIPV